MKNEVLETTEVLLENPQFVKINDERILQLAGEWGDQDFKLPTWDFPIYPAEKNNRTIDFQFLVNSINFAFTDFETKEKYTSHYGEKKNWRGAFGMIACLKRALDEGVPILEGDFLKDISLEQTREMFQGNFEIPMLKERHEIFNEVGEVLTEKYDGHFYNLVAASKNRLFNGGKGMVERLVNDFPSFDDSVMYNGKKVVFNKRAQLACAMIYEKFEGEIPIYDIDDITVFLDYVLPKGLRDKGSLVYEKSLARRVDNQEIIEAGSLEELEIRASTAHVADMLTKEINVYREVNNLSAINALHMDAKLWLESRGKGGHPHHLTPTIAY